LCSAVVCWLLLLASLAVSCWLNISIWLGGCWLLAVGSYGTIAAVSCWLLADLAVAVISLAVSCWLARLLLWYLLAVIR
jgi:hypothetical protein